MRHGGGLWGILSSAFGRDLTEWLRRLVGGCFQVGWLADGDLIGVRVEVVVDQIEGRDGEGRSGLKGSLRGGLGFINERFMASVVRALMGSGLGVMRRGRGHGATVLLRRRWWSGWDGGGGPMMGVVVITWW
ncbi:hypothetical protein M0R45_034751 [Rubus argutus]|uniref:Uncharacterized protein n=1 Tax=Rubus argutus TaxID=59490 RepID=A0AAW1VV74_RUBAR